MGPGSLKGSVSVPRGVRVISVLELERGRVRSAIFGAVGQAIR